jgi:Spy/CpxP family protein refolding chaperone
MVTMNARLLFVLSASVLVLGCAKKADRAPLPGDSVQDGSVTLTPARVPVAAPATDARPRGAEPLSAIESKLFPPELVMEHQAAIALTPAQRDAVAKETERAHAELLKLQWELDEKKEKLVAVLDADKVDEAASKQAAAEVMKREDAIKAGHLAMLVRIKNVLSKEQQEKLRAIRDAERCGPRTSPSPSSGAPPR